MKLQPDRTLGQTITGHGDGWLAIDGEKFHQNLLIAWTGLRQEWQGNLDNFYFSKHLSSLRETQLEILLIGCGKQKAFVPMEWVIPFLQQNIGVESMDTVAACRTYNILASENRKVAAILFI
jgi:uncharacterized protein